MCIIRSCDFEHTHEEYAHALTTASLWHQFPSPLFKQSTAPPLSWLCSAVAGLSSLHPSIPLSGPAQWFIIHLGSCLPPTLCTRTALAFCLVPSYAAPTCVLWIWGMILRPSQWGCTWNGYYCSCMCLFVCGFATVLCHCGNQVGLSVSALFY